MNSRTEKHKMLTIYKKQLSDPKRDVDILIKEIDINIASIDLEMEVMMDDPEDVGYLREFKKQMQELRSSFEKVKIKSRTSRSSAEPIVSASRQPNQTSSLQPNISAQLNPSASTRPNLPSSLAPNPLAQSSASVNINPSALTVSELSDLAQPNISAQPRLTSSQQRQAERQKYEARFKLEMKKVVVDMARKILLKKGKSGNDIEDISDTIVTDKIMPMEIQSFQKKGQDWKHFLMNDKKKIRAENFCTDYFNTKYN
jgi:hypothetical protein